MSLTIRYSDYPADNGSPFALALANYRRCGTLRAQFLAQFSDCDLDEFAQCARYELSRPVHSMDASLLSFADMATETLHARYELRTSADRAFAATER